MTNKTTKWHYFTGVCEYYRNKSTDNYGNYSIKIKLDDIEQYKETGIQGKLDEDGCVWFRRPQSKLIKNELIQLGAPITIDNNGNELEELVGSDSKIEVKVRSYPTIKGVGHTLEGVKVLELVPVESENGEYKW